MSSYVILETVWSLKQNLKKGKRFEHKFLIWKNRWPLQLSKRNILITHGNNLKNLKNKFHYIETLDLKFYGIRIKIDCAVTYGHPKWVVYVHNFRFLSFENVFLVCYLPNWFFFEGSNESFLRFEKKLDQAFRCWLIESHFSHSLTNSCPTVFPTDSLSEESKTSQLNWKETIS